MGSIYTFVRRIEDLIAPRFQFYDQVLVGGINELAPKPPHRVRVAVTPAPISTICKAPLAEIDGRPGRTKIRESLFVPHELTSNTKLDPSQADFGNPPFRQRW